MKASQFRKIEGHPLRQVFLNMVTDSRDLPTRSQLRAAIDEAVPEADAATRDKLFESAVALAQKAATEGRDSWFDLRQEVNHRVLGLVESWEAAEQLVPSGDDDVDVSSVLDSIDGWNPAERNLRAVESAAKDAELRGNLARQIGGQS